MAPSGRPAEDSRSISSAMTRLKQAQKSSKGAPIYSVAINRPVGRLFAAVAFRLGMTPNQVTAVSAVFTFAGIAVLAVVPPRWWVGILVSALLAIGYALDSADGQLARLRGGGSLTGEWLDHTVDSVKVLSLHLAVLVMAARSGSLPPNSAWLLVPMVFGLSSSVHFFGMILVEQLAREHRARFNLPTPPKTAGINGLRSLMKAPTDYGILCWVFALLGVGWLFGLVYGLLALGMTGYTAMVCGKWYRDVSAIDHERRLFTTQGGSAEHH